jgi:hypothetical protein
LKDGSAFESGGREYLRTFTVVEAAYRSVSEQRAVSVTEILAPGGQCVFRSGPARS